MSKWHGRSQKLTRGLNVVMIALMLLGQFSPERLAKAIVTLAVTPLTWNVIGLDSNNVNVGPNNFPVGARVCNTSGSAVNDVTATFVWDSTNSYLDLRTDSLSSITLPTLPAGSVATPSCYDFYFEVTVTRNSAAYDTKRQFHIEISDGVTTFTTPQPRELYVEHLISQNRNSTNMISYALGASPASLTDVPTGGTMSLQVGNIYTIRLDGSTATQGYNQLEDFINFPNTVFQILAVASHYSADSSTFVTNSNDKLYSDACLWDMDPASPNYRSCIGSDGKAGGTISTTYTVKIIGGVGGTQTLGSLIYDFSGSSYHYNSDYSSGVRFATVTSPLTLSKSFSPISIAPGETSTMTISITNGAASVVSNISITDELPGGMTLAATPKLLATGCNFDTLANYAYTSASVAGIDSVSLTGGSISAGAACILEVDVTSSAANTYLNTTKALYIDGGDTGLTASAGLEVAARLDGTGFCSTGVEMAKWSVPSTATDPPDTAGGLPTSKDAGVTTAVVLAGNPALTKIDNTASGLHGDNYSWDTWGYKNGGQELEFTLTIANFKDIKLDFDMSNPSGASGPSTVTLSYSTNGGDTYTDVTPTLTPLTGWSHFSHTFTGLTQLVGNTKFKILGSPANNDAPNADLLFDNMVFTGTKLTGCTAVGAAPTLTKSFQTSTIALNDPSNLVFTMGNTNTTALTGAAFTDTLPTGLTVVDATSSLCGGTLTTTAPDSISFSGGVIPAAPYLGSNGSCEIGVIVTGAAVGTFVNTIGYISTAESGTKAVSATDFLKVLAPPVISKAFSPNAIYANETSKLIFTITNPNPVNALSGVSFLDTYPAGMTRVSAPTASQCGGTVSSTSNSVSLSGGFIAAAGSCTVSIDITASTVKEYDNSTGPVSSTNAGLGNTATAQLVVQAKHPGISILKEVATSPTGPWATAVNVAPGGSVYYRLTVENIGDVPLSPVSVTDPTLTISSCIWPTILPVSAATVSPSASCIVGPISPQFGEHTNTATAHGTYNSTVYNSPPKTAKYTTTDLVLVKSATQTSFTAAGDVLNYSYLITNNGTSTLTGPLAVTDTNTTVDCSAYNGVLAPAASVTCTATYTVTAFDALIGSVTNTAYATLTLNPGPGTVVSNMDRKTVYSTHPDLVVIKSNNKNGLVTLGTSFIWTFTVSNYGAQDAVISVENTILQDQLPAGATYAQPVVGTGTNVTNIGAVICSIDANNLLDCMAGNGGVTLGATTGSFPITVVVTPTALGALTNPASNVDMSNSVSESNEGNNTGADEINVLPARPTVSKVFGTGSGVPDIASGGGISLTVTIGNENVDPITLTSTFTDTFPAGMTIKTDGFTGSCTGVTSIAGQGSFSMAAGTTIPSGGCNVILDVTTATAGTQTNTIPVDSLTTDSGTNASEATADLNVYAPPTVSKSFNPSTVVVGTGSVLSLILTNPASNPGSLSTVSVNDDPFPSGMVLADTNFVFTPTSCGTVTKTSGQPSEANDSAVQFTVTPPLAAGSACQVDMNVTSASTGTLNNSTGAPSAIGPIPLSGQPDTATLIVLASSSLQVVKSSTTTNVTAAGQVVPYTFTLTYVSGPVPAALQADNPPAALSGITVTDANCDAVPVYQSGDTNTDGLLQPTETWIYACDRTVSQAEFQAGTLTNTVTVNSTEQFTDTDTLNIPITHTPTLNVVKTSPTTTVTTAGQVVPYTFTVTFAPGVTPAALHANNPVALSGITVVDAHCDATPTYQSGDTNTDTLLQPDETWIYTCDRTVSQAEFDTGGNLSNTVTVNSTEQLSGNDTLDIPITSNAGPSTVYLPFITNQPVVTQAWNISVGFEDNPLLYGWNDFDYNDWAVAIDAVSTYDGATTLTRAVSMNFTPLTRGASYDHKFTITVPSLQLNRSGKATLKVYDRNHNLLNVKNVEFTSAANQVIEVFAPTSEALPGTIVNTNEYGAFVAPQRYATLDILFDQAVLLNTSLSELSKPHGDTLFFEPSLNVINTGERIHNGDVRMLVIPTSNWKWPEENIRIDRAYPLVKFAPGFPPVIQFPTNWWQTPGTCLYDGVACIR